MRWQAVKRAVLPTFTHLPVGKTPPQKAQNQPKYNINVIITGILALKHSINVTISCFTQENAKRKAPPFYFSF